MAVLFSSGNSEMRHSHNERTDYMYLFNHAISKLAPILQYLICGTQFWTCVNLQIMLNIYAIHMCPQEYFSMCRHVGLKLTFDCNVRNAYTLLETTKRICLFKKKLCTKEWCCRKSLVIILFFLYGSSVTFTGKAVFFPKLHGCNFVVVMCFHNVSILVMVEEILACWFVCESVLSVPIFVSICRKISERYVGIPGEREFKLA